MFNFTKIFGLAGTVMMLTGLAYGQNGSCTSVLASQVPLIRTEGTTELVGELTISCGGSTATAIPASTVVNITDILSQPVTSKILTSSSSTSEAAVFVNGVLAAQGIYTAGSTQIVFSNIALPATAGNATDIITITNVRVNANALPTTGGTPTAVTETVFISGSNLNANVLAGTAVAYGLPGLAAQTVYGAGDSVVPTNTNGVFNVGSLPTTKTLPTQLVCNQIAFLSGPIASIEVGENFPTAFKGAGSTATNTTLGSEFSNNTESGVAVGANSAASGTFLQVVFANIPTNFAVYLPLTIYSDQGTGATLTLQTAASGTFTGATAAKTSSTAGTSSTTSLVAISSGAGTAYYLFTPGAGTTSSSTQESFNIPVYGAAAAATVVPTTTAITAQVSFAPVGVAGNIPSFTVGASSTTLTLDTFTACTTSLLFPFVTNQLGFDTGIAISNTTSDPFKTLAQSGTCTLYFYGSGAPSPNSVVTPAVAAGTTYANTISSLAAGFQGYAIATCGFQLGHGFAFITSGLGGSSGIAEGYLAGVLSRGVNAGTEGLSN